jgi:hypothetical protein
MIKGGVRFWTLAELHCEINIIGYTLPLTMFVSSATVEALVHSEDEGRQIPSIANSKQRLYITC